MLQCCSYSEVSAQAQSCSMPQVSYCGYQLSSAEHGRKAEHQSFKLDHRETVETKEYHDRTRKLDSELHGSQQDQRGPIESELNEYGHRGRVLAPVIGRYGGASSDLSLILDLVAREMARKHTAFYNIGFSEAKALFRQKLARKWGHAIALLCFFSLPVSLLIPALRGLSQKNKAARTRKPIRRTCLFCEV